MSSFRPELTPEVFNARSAGHLPGLVGLRILTMTPQGASGFTTIEIKSNFLGTALEGAIFCRATPAHLGRTTQVWDAVVTIEGTEKRIALFRCTQMVLWPR